jgi:hypothetical protein
MSNTRNLKGTFYCRVCCQWYPAEDNGQRIFHYNQHVQFLDLLIKDLDIKTQKEDNDVVSESD